MSKQADPQIAPPGSFAGLRLADSRFLLALLLPVLSLLNTMSGAVTMGVAALVIWAAVAGVDALVPGACRSPAAALDGRVLMWLPRLYVPLQLLLIAAGLYASQALSWPAVLGLCVGIGFVTGAQGITFAHELGHGKSRFDRFLAWTLMASVNYSHFMVEHYRGHHPRAATWDDPASAREGESLLRFLPRTLAGSFASALKLEALRLQQFHKTWLHSPLAWCLAGNLVFLAALAALGGAKMAAFWLGQSVMAVWLLETVNYIEHYGLQRKTTASGGREAFGMMHAWNADHVLSNSLLLNLQRHSDHHMHAWKQFPTLEPLPGPQLPTGYAGCLLLAAIPPLWFRLMHPRLQALRA